ncbi:MAG: T9SS type A sorting domain-containing protein [Chitinophagaceae bacterium]|nr:T9SS type A sorting domain-containing protein [Chitinophagaceae bacterium]
MKKILFLFCCLASCLLHAQTFTNYTGYALPANGQTLLIPITVSGLPALISGSFGVTKITLGISHPSDQELEVKLKSPDNTQLLLFTSIGGQNSVDFRNTQLQNNAPYNIIEGTPPYNGSYFPMQDINVLNNGQNPNATWFLIVTDTYPMANNGTLDSVSIEFGNNPPAYPPTVFVCPTCNCPPGITDCDLLPDMTSSEKVILDDMIETLGSLKIGNGTPNIGLGPLEVRPVDSCFCGLVQVPCWQTSCPNNDPVSQRLHQRIYRKHAGTDTLTFYDVPAGNMSYHPNHGHIHVDNWADFTLREKTIDPDPRNWPVIGTSVKQSYCLINLSSCDGYSGACKDNLGNVLDQQNQFINYGLGYLSGCGKFQGIWPGKLDIYSSGLNSAINMQGLCNGDYYIVSITDPDSTFRDQDYSNNVSAVPIVLSQQIPASTAHFTTTQNGTQVMVNATGLVPGSNYVWDFGDNSPLQSVNPATHNYAANGDFEIMLWVQTPCGDRTEFDTVKITGAAPVAIAESVSDHSFFSVSPNPTRGRVELSLLMKEASPIKISVVDVLGKISSRFINMDAKAGLQKVMIDLNDFKVGAGIYLLTCETNKQKFVQKIVLTP